MRSTFLLIVLLSPLFAVAQSVRVINSSLQRWSGGVAGHRGENYLFVVDCPSCTEQPEFETIWIGSLPFKLNGAENSGQSSTSVKKVLGKQYRYEITVRIAHDDYAEREKVMRGEVDTQRQQLPAHYTGRAFLQYTSGGKKLFLNIKSILHYLPDINYP